jgi:hypothetical protein
MEEEEEEEEEDATPALVADTMEAIHVFPCSVNAKLPPPPDLTPVGFQWLSSFLSFAMVSFLVSLPRGRCKQGR